MVKKWKLDSRIKDFSTTVVAFVKKREKEQNWEQLKCLSQTEKGCFFKEESVEKESPGRCGIQCHWWQLDWALVASMATMVT